MKHFKLGLLTLTAVAVGIIIALDKKCCKKDSRDIESEDEFLNIVVEESTIS